MTKEELITLLRNYKENVAKLELRRLEKRKLINKLNELKNIEIASTTTQIGINMDIHSKNQISNKTEKTALKNIENRQNLEKQIEKIDKEIVNLEFVVNDIDIRLKALKYKEREILYAYYIEGRSYEDIGNNLYFKLFNQTRDKDTIRSIAEKAIKKMTNL